MRLFRKRPAGPRISELDMKVLEQLKKAGSDLSQPLQQVRRDQSAG